MNELVLYAQIILNEEEISPCDVIIKLNDVLMSCADNNRLCDALTKMDIKR